MLFQIQPVTVAWSPNGTIEYSDTAFKPRQEFRDAQFDHKEASERAWPLWKGMVVNRWIVWLVNGASSRLWPFLFTEWGGTCLILGTCDWCIWHPLTPTSYRLPLAAVCCRMQPWLIDWFRRQNYFTLTTWHNPYPATWPFLDAHQRAWPSPVSFI